MKSLLIEEQGKTIREKIENALVQIWPSVYNAINGLVTILLGTVKRMGQIVLEQIGLKK